MCLLCVSASQTALGFVQRADRHELAAAIVAYGGEHPLAARRIADAVALAKQQGTLPERTHAFARLVSDAKGKEYQAMHAAKMTFQALRITVNKEYEELRGGLKAAMELLRDGGKVSRGSYLPSYGCTYRTANRLVGGAEWWEAFGGTLLEGFS